MKALITGASSGIGKELAYRLSELGYDLILVARNNDKLEEVKKNLHTKVEIIPLDLTKIENCYKLHKEVKNIDILINNAGFGLFGEFKDTSLETELNMINLNIIALHTLCKLYLQDFMKTNTGKILNVASIAGFLPGPLMSTYYATKSYVVRLSQSIKEELKRQKSHVTISVLCPGPVKTNFDNVAGVTFSLKGQTSKYVANYALDKFFKDKFMIIPGIKIKLLKIISKIIPDKILSKFVYNSQQRKR